MALNISEDNDFYMLAKDFSSSLHTDDGDDTNGFVWVIQEGPESCSSNIEISHFVHGETHIGVTDKIVVTHCDKADLELDEDYSYDAYLKEYDTTVGKVSHNKKACHQRRRQRQVTFLKTFTNPEEEGESSHPVFNMFDGLTTKILKSVISNNSSHSGQYGKIIAKCGNSVIIHALISEKCYVHNFAIDKDYQDWKWLDCAVKVYKLSDNQMKNERIFQQVQIEKDHLQLLYTKSNVPEVIRCSRNVIVMTMLGEDQETAPSVASSPLKHSQETYQDIVEEMEMWYKKLHLVHGKLSPKNIIYWNDRLYYIGWSHSVTTDHPYALRKLMRDCQIITKFFERRLIPVKSTERLFKDITGLKKIDSSVLGVIHSEDLWKNQLLTNPNRAGHHTYSTKRNCRFKV